MTCSLLLAGLLVAAQAEPKAPATGIPTVLKELWAEGVRSTVQYVHVQRRPGQRPDSVVFIVHVRLTPTDNGTARLHSTALGTFFNHWSGAVNARGVQMQVEHIHFAPAGSSGGADVRITGVLR